MKVLSWNSDLVEEVINANVESGIEIGKINIPTEVLCKIITKIMESVIISIWKKVEFDFEENGHPILGKFVGALGTACVGSIFGAIIFPLIGAGCLTGVGVGAGFGLAFWGLGHLVSWFKHW